MLPWKCDRYVTRFLSFFLLYVQSTENIMIYYNILSLWLKNIKSFDEFLSAISCDYKRRKNCNRYVTIRFVTILSKSSSSVNQRYSIFQILCNILTTWSTSGCCNFNVTSAWSVVKHVLDNVSEILSFVIYFSQYFVHHIWKLMYYHCRRLFLVC